jgi:hypothetical protein
MVGKEEKTAEEVVALIHKDLNIPGVYLKVFRHRHVGGYATALPALLPQLGVFNLTWKESSSICGSFTISRGECLGTPPRRLCRKAP